MTDLESFHVLRKLPYLLPPPSTVVPPETERRDPIQGTLQDRVDSAELKDFLTQPGCAIKLQPSSDLERVFALAQIKDELVRGPGVIQNGCVRC